MIPSVPSDSVPDHLIHESEMVIQAIFDALDPIADKTRMDIFMRALNIYYFAYLLHYLYDDDQDLLASDVEALIQVHRENIEEITRND